MRVTLLLVVEDDDLRLFISLVLRQDPRLEVLGVESLPSEALALADIVRPDLIILDVAPSSAPSLQAVHPGTKILMFTNDKRQHTNGIARVDGCVRKENIVQVLAIVQDMLGLGAGSREAG